MAEDDASRFRPRLTLLFVLLSAYLTVDLFLIPARGTSAMWSSLTGVKK